LFDLVFYAENHQNRADKNNHGKEAATHHVVNKQARSLIDDSKQKASQRRKSSY
jgi:hypothetical protein